MSVRSLGFGTIKSIGATNSEQILYTVPNDKQAVVNLMEFVNTSASTVTITIYKKVKKINYAISPFEMSFPAGYLAQEDGKITLGNNDQIVAVCSTNNVVSFTINGEEMINLSTN